MNNFEFKIIDQLDRLMDIQDVYFHRGTLYVLNDSDSERVETFLTECGYDVLMRVCSEEVAY